MKLAYLALLTVFAAAGAQAQAPAPGHSNPVEDACANEIKQLCPGQTGKAAGKCLQSNLKSNPSSISSGCSTALKRQMHQHSRKM